MAFLTPDENDSPMAARRDFGLGPVATLSRRFWFCASAMVAIKIHVAVKSTQLIEGLNT